VRRSRAFCSRCMPASLSRRGLGAVAFLDGVFLATMSFGSAVGSR